MIRTFLALSLVALPSTIAADTVAAGFKSSLQPYPGQAATRTLADGRILTSDGSLVQRWTSAGAFEATIGNFASAGTVGLMVIDPSEQFVVVGNATSGEIIRVDVNGVGQATLGFLPNNEDADFESPSSIILSTSGPVAGTVLLFRMDTNTGAQSPLALVQGLPGPLAIDNFGSLFYATVDPSGAPGTTSVISFAGAAIANPPAPAFQIINDLIVIEVESQPPIAEWTAYTTYPGFTGASYYRWDGSDHFQSPGFGILTYEFEVLDGGNYLYRLHNRHNHPESDQENDIWFSMDGSPWTKIYSNYGTGSVGVWNWHTWVEEDDGDKYQCNFNLSPGRHTLRLSARANGFMIDRMVFFKNGFSESTATQLSQPPSPMASFNQTAASTLVSGLDGASEMIHEPERDIFILAENNYQTGFNRVANINKLGVTGTYVNGDPFQIMGNLDFTPQAGTGTFFPFQPPGNGTLTYTRTGAVTQRRLLETQRPTLTLSGEGAATGLGPTMVTVAQAVPNGFALLVLCPTPFVSPTELAIPIGGIPLHTPFLLSASTIVQTPLLCNPSGAVSLNFTNQLGAVDVFGVQAVITDPLGLAVGTTTIDML